MNVQQLIEELQKIEDKSLEVCVCQDDKEYTDREGEECTVFEPVETVHNMGDLAASKPFIVLFPRVEVSK